MACCENPKRVYGEKGRSPQTRMGNIAGFREAFGSVWRYVAAGLVVLVLGAAFGVAAYGNESFERVSPGEMAAVQWVYDRPGNAQVLFVTTRTVEGHLTSVFRKLQVESRNMLPAALGDRTPVPAGLRRVAHPPPATGVMCQCLCTTHHGGKT